MNGLLIYMQVSSRLNRAIENDRGIKLNYLRKLFGLKLAYEPFSLLIVTHFN